MLSSFIQNSLLTYCREGAQGWQKWEILMAMIDSKIPSNALSPGSVDHWSHICYFEVLMFPSILIYLSNLHCHSTGLAGCWLTAQNSLIWIFNLQQCSRPRPNSNRAMFSEKDQEILKSHSAMWFCRWIGRIEAVHEGEQDNHHSVAVHLLHISKQMMLELWLKKDTHPSSCFASSYISMPKLGRNQRTCRNPQICLRRYENRQHPGIFYSNSIGQQKDYSAIVSCNYQRWNDGIEPFLGYIGAWRPYYTRWAQLDSQCFRQPRETFMNQDSDVTFEHGDVQYTPRFRNALLDRDTEGRKSFLRRK